MEDLKLNRLIIKSHICARWLTKLLCLLILSSQTSISAFANTASLVELHRIIRDGCNEIMSGIDIDAVIDVEIIPETRKKAKLPGTANEIGGGLVINDNGLPKISSITIKVYSKQGVLTKDVEEILLRQGKVYSSNTKIVVAPALTGYTKKEPVPQQLDLSPIKNTIESFGSRLFIALSIAAGGIILLMFAAFDSARQHRKQIHALMQSSQVIAQALDAASQGAARPRLEASSNHMDNTRLLGAGSREQDVLHEMNDASIAAVFSDAYWCEKDGYAASIWRRIPISSKQVLLSGLPFARDYATYLANIEESPESWEQHPYYLTPNSLWHLNNKDIAEIIRKHPDLFKQLPPMRVEALPIPPSELILLMQRASNSSPSLFDWSKVPASTIRRFKTNTLLLSRTVADDEQLLNMQNVSLSEMRQIKSLVWADRLSDEDLKEILKGMPAVDLASSWIAPEKIIQRFEQALPEKKLRIVKSYLEKNKPERESVAFEMFHGLIIERLAQNESIKHAS